MTLIILEGRIRLEVDKVDFNSVYSQPSKRELCSKNQQNQKDFTKFEIFCRQKGICCERASSILSAQGQSYQLEGAFVLTSTQNHRIIHLFNIIKY